MNNNIHKLDLNQATPQAPEMPSTEVVKPEVDETTSNYNNDNSMSSFFNKTFIVLALLVIAGGVATGYGGFKLQGGSTLGPKPSNLQRIAEKDQIQAGDVFGVEDSKTFKDSAEGYLEIGGINGEGSHKLLREGGASQTVALTSTVTDLDDFDGMEVKIWGETFKGQEAGWLMDVGRIEVVNLDGQAPTEE